MVALAGPSKPSGIVARGGEGIVGAYTAITIRDGLSLALTNLRYSNDCIYRDVVEDHIKLHFKLSGKSSISGEYAEEVPIEPGLMSFLVQPARSLKVEKIFKNSHERSATVIASREFVGHLFFGSSNE